MSAEQSVVHPPVLAHFMAASEAVPVSVADPETAPVFRKNRDSELVRACVVLVVVVLVLLLAVCGMVCRRRKAGAASRPKAAGAGGVDACPISGLMPAIDVNRRNVDDV
jgi:hypothetical protein